MVQQVALKFDTEAGGASLGWGCECIATVVKCFVYSRDWSLEVHESHRALRFQCMCWCRELVLLLTLGYEWEFS
jgi:hypothetical protein